MRHVLAVLAACVLVLPCAAHAAIPKAARTLHAEAIVVDTHVDTTQRLLDPAFDLGERHADGGIDIPRMRAGGLDAAFFSIWVPATVTGQAAVDAALAQIEAVQRQVAAHPRDLVLATTVAGIRAAAAEGRIAVLLGLEGGHMIAGDLANLRRFFDLGVRYMTLTHGLNTPWADSSTDTPRSAGLNDFGREVLREMNRLGMMVDISHVSDATFDDVLALSGAPVIASHSSARALCRAARNMNDRMIRELARHGGVMQVNYHMGFLSQPYRDALQANDGRIDKAIDALSVERCGADEGCKILAGSALARERVAAGTLPRVEWTAIADHIAHAAARGGAAHVGLGSDFDGADMPFGMEDASSLPMLTAELLRRGHTDAEVRGILGENLLRVMSEVEAVAAGGGTGAAEPAAHNTLSAEEQRAGWRLLFDGHTLAGWRGYRAAPLPSGWRVDGGTLHRAGRGGDIATVDSFADFELSLEWKVAEGGNSGIFYRAALGQEQIYLSAPEMQVLDDARHRDGRDPLTSAGAAYGLYPAPRGVVRAAGEWNQARVRVQDGQVEHWLNGQKLLEYSLGSPDWQARVARSKFAKWPVYGVAPAGHIGLQDHGDPVWFRNIKIRVLD